jgi:hypothetical protein
VLLVKTQTERTGKRKGQVKVQVGVFKAKLHGKESETAQRT